MLTSRTPSRAWLAVVAALALSTALLPGAMTAGASADDATGERQQARAGSVLIVGSGYGHGHGLSQWGAKSQADRGRSTRQILRFYYPGLRFGTVGGRIKVLMTDDERGNSVVVRDRSRLRAKSVGPRKEVLRLTRMAGGRARWWRLVPRDGGRSTAVDWKGRGKGWHRLRILAGQAQFTAGGRPMTLHTPEGRTAYRGALRSARPAPGSRHRDTVNVVRLETYLRGVVPQEVPASWHPAAVRAQAVAARTYAAFERGRPLARHYQVCDTSACQVYGGAAAEHPASDSAIRATSQQVLLAGGEPAFTQFSASNGGATAAGSFDYLPAKPDPYDTAYRDWRVRITDEAIERAVPAIGNFRRVEVVRRDGNGSYGGRVAEIRIGGSQRAVTVSGDDFRSWFGLRSTLFDVR